MVKRLSDWLENVVFLCFAATVVVTFVQILARYLFNSSLGWSEEMARWLNIAVAMFGGAIAVHRGAHMTFDLYLNKLPPGAFRLVRILNNFLVAVFVVVMGFYGWELALMTMPTPSPSMQIPQGIAYMIMPLAAILTLIYLVVDTGKLIQGTGRSGKRTEADQ